MKIVTKLFKKNVLKIQLNPTLQLRAIKIINTITDGINYYLNNWQQLQGRDIFPINSNEDSQKIKNIIINLSTLKETLDMAEEKEHIEELEAALLRLCDYNDLHFGPFLQLIKDSIAHLEQEKLLKTLAEIRK